MWVPIPPSAEAALAGATVLANLSGSPITIARAEDRTLLVRSASARCSAAYVFAAAGQGESTTDLSWDGQTMVYECGELLAEGERFPDSARMTVADVDLDRIRAGAASARAPSTTTGAPTTTGSASSAASSSSSSRPRATSASGARSTGSRSCRTTRSGSRWTATRPTTSRSPASSSGCAYIGEPKVVIGVTGGLDSTHALIVAARAMDRLGRPRSDIHAFTMPGFATGDTTRSYATRLAKSLGVTFEEIDITASARQMLTDIDHPFADGEEVYDVTFENVQAGLRYDYLFRLANHRGGDRGRHRRPVRARARLVHLRRRRPDVALQRQRRRAEDARPAPDPLGRRQRPVRRRDQRPAARDRRPGDHPRADPDPRGRAAPVAPRTSVGPYTLQDFTLFHVLRHGFRPEQDRVPGLARVARRGRRRLAAGLPGVSGAWRTTSPTSAAGSRSSSGASSPASSSARRCPTAPRSPPAAPCRPAATGGCPRTPRPTAWLAELENVPDEVGAASPRFRDGRERRLNHRWSSCACAASVSTRGELEARRLALPSQSTEPHP